MLTKFINSIGTRLIAGYLIITALALGIGLVGYNQIGRINTILEQEVTERVEARYLSTTIRTQSAQIAELLQGYGTELSPDELARLDILVEDSLITLGEFYDQADRSIRSHYTATGESQSILGGDELEIWNTLALTYQGFLDRALTVKKIYHSEGEGAPGLRTHLALAQFEANWSRLWEGLIKLENQETSLLYIAQEMAQDTARRALAFMLSLGLGALVGGIILGVGISLSITRPLGHLVQAAERITAGDLSKPVSVSTRTEVGALARVFNAMARQLQALIGGLEERVAERTAELEEANQRNEQRAKQFEAITLVSTATSSIRSLKELLPRITELISQQFGYYHAGIFLNDLNNENAVLSAANSEGGQRMLKRGHQLKIGEQGIVGYAISTAEARIALDVGEDAVYFDNPDLPDTRSEMALPLKVGDTIVGALDVQSTQESAFSEEDINVLSVLADQVSLAIDNARLFGQSRRSLAELETMNRQFLRQAWGRLPKEQNLAGFRYNVHGASPIEAKTQFNNTGSGEEETKEGNNSGVSVPIVIRGETIGTLSVHIPADNNINADQMDLVNAVAERVALSAENARLFEETTRRAERERLVSDITVKIRSTNDPEVMIQTALDELKDALGATNVQLLPHALKTPQESLEPTTTPPPSDEKPSRSRRKKKGEEK